MIFSAFDASKHFVIVGRRVAVGLAAETLDELFRSILLIPVYSGVKEGWDMIKVLKGYV